MWNEGTITQSHPHHILLRGGRMTKWKGVVASIAPTLGRLATVISLPALGLTVTLSAGGAMLATPAAADCAGAFGTYTCSNATFATQTLSSPGDLTVTLDPSFAVTTAAGSALDLTADGNLTLTQDGTGAINGNADGIYALVNPGGGGLSLTIVGPVTGEGYGISAGNKGSGALSITTSGDVTATTDNGILAWNMGGTDLTLDVAGVTGGRYGISAGNKGSGALSITASGDVTATTYDGIWVVNEGTDLTLDVAGVTGGIDALSYGSGALSITASRAMTGGVLALSRGTDLTLNVAAVASKAYGILASNNGSGALSITTSGAVTGTNDEGIHASNSGTDLTLGVAGVTGGRNGIYADNDGSGALSITADGDVTATTYDGIIARNFGTDLTLDVAAVSGGRGILADNNGSGALSITASGTVTGEAGDGINADNSAAGTNLTLDVAAVSGRSDGIYADNDGSGALLITASGTVTGGTGYGIDARNEGTDLTLEVAGVSGDDVGIRAFNAGGGALSITASGAVTGQSSHGIAAYDIGAGGISVSANDDVSGGEFGIFADNAGSGDVALTIAARARVQGWAVAVSATSSAGLTLTNHGTLQNTNGAAKSQVVRATSAMTLINNAVMTGQLDLSDAADSMTNTGTWNTRGASIFGAGNDSLTSSGIIVAADNPGAYEATSFLSVDTFTNSGTLSLSDGGANDTLFVGGTFQGGGTLVLDAVLGGAGSSGDMFRVAATATGSTGIRVNNIGGLGADGANILLVDTNGSDAGTFFLEGGPIILGDFVYDLFWNGEDFFLQSI